MNAELIGKRIRELRVALNMRQETLADGIVSRSYISQIENGITTPSFDTLLRLSSKLNCTISDLLSDDEQKKQDSLTFHFQALQFQAEHCLEKKMWNEFIEVMNSIANERTLEVGHNSAYQFLYARYYWERQDYIRSNEYAETCIRHSYPSEFEYRAKAFNLQGRILYLLGQPQNSLQSFNNALQIVQQLVSDPLLHVEILLNLGVLHSHIDELTSSISYLLEAIHINKTKGTFYKYGEIFMTLGVCYKRIGNIKEARESHWKAYQKFEELNIELLKAGTLVNLGIISNIERDYEQSLQFLNQAIELYTKLSETNGLINAKLEKGEVYLNIQKLVEVKQLCDELLSFNLKEQIKAQVFVLLGKMNSQNRNISEALDYFFQSKAIYQQSSQNSKLKSLYGLIGEAYYLEKDFESSAYYFRLATQNNAKLNNREEF